MSHREVENAINRMVQKGQAGAMTVAAPLNDVQLLALVSAILHAGNPALTPGDVEDSVRDACAIVAKSATAVRTGFMGRAINAAMEEENAALTAANRAKPEEQGH